MKRTLCAAGFALAMAAPTGLAAQETPQSPAFTDAQIEAFAEAAVDIQVLTQQARQQMMQIIQNKEGLDVDTYNQMLQAAQQDSALGDKITQSMEAYAEESGIPQAAPPAPQGE